MPAVSKAQQQAAGAALAAKEKGDAKGLKGAAKSMAKMSKAELEKIASTKHKGLPKHVKESIEETAMMDEAMQGFTDNVYFWMVEKPEANGANPLALVYPEDEQGMDPFTFAKIVMGGLTPNQVYGFYTSKDDALNAAHDVVVAVNEAAKALEAKKMDVSSKIEETIKKLQKEVNRCMDEGDDMGAQQKLERISQLREKYNMVEASKKPLEDEEGDSKKKVNEGAFDRLKARLKGTGANVSTRFSNLGAYLKGDKDAIKDPALAKNLAILQQKARTLDKALVDVINDVNKLFPEETLQKAPAEFGPIFSRYLDLIDKTRTLNTSIASGNLSTGAGSNKPSTQSTTPSTTTQQASSQASATNSNAAQQQQPTTTTQPQPSATKTLKFDDKTYTLDNKGRVRVTFNGKRTYFKPLEYKGHLFIPLVKDKNGQVKQVEKRGDKLYVMGTNIEVDIKGLKEIHI